MRKELSIISKLNIIYMQNLFLQLKLLLTKLLFIVEKIPRLRKEYFYLLKNI